MAKMMNIEKLHPINPNQLSGEFYFASILQEAYARGLLSASEVENVQLQCIQFLAYKSKRYNGCDSSSLRVETAETIMKSNLFTIGVFLKSLPDPETAVSRLKTTPVPDLYQKGKALITEKLQNAQHMYERVKSNKTATTNYTYNATLDQKGIGIFFRQYDPDYAAHETPASIDYQLCNPVADLAGVEFIQQYLENLFWENEFCQHFATEKIDHLLYGYHEGYEDLLINIFEQILTSAMGCILANRPVTQLALTKEDIQHLHQELSKCNHDLVACKFSQAAKEMLEELNISNNSLRSYIAISLPKIICSVTLALQTNTLNKTLIIPVDPYQKSKIQFFTGTKMDDEDYRKIINELLECSHSSDKLELIKEKVKSFGDLQDLLFDAMLSEQETSSVLGMLGNVELAALLKRHPYHSDLQAVDLSESEHSFRLYLEKFIHGLPSERQEKIFDMVKDLVDA